MFCEELLHNILSYSNDLRILKIKMNKTNIKYLFDNDRNIYNYLFAKTSSTMARLGECIYLKTIEMLNDKSTKMEMIFDKLVVYFEKYSYTTCYEYLSYEYYDVILNIIINDYNNYYLNDKYYYNGEGWYDEEWYDEEWYDKEWYDEEDF